LISKPKSSSEFTLLKEENLSEFDKERIQAIEQISTHLNEKEAQEFLERNRKGLHSDYYKIKDNTSKIRILDTGELELPSGKVLGHWDYK